jgi:co-chaperonin GroES (HSP10)
LKNESGIHPLGHRVLVLPEFVEEKTESGIIIHHGNQLMREEMAQIKAIVVEVGTTAYNDQDSKWCKAGDRVVIGKYSGLLYKGKDEKSYRIINDLDVVAMIEEGVK